MKKKLFTTAALIVGAVVICLAAIFADLTGKWTGTLKTATGDLPVTLDLKADGEKLTGTATSDAGVLPIADGKISGNNFVFNLDLNGSPLKNTGKFYGDGDSVVVDVDYQGTMMHGVFKRVVEKK